VKFKNPMLVVRDIKKPQEFYESVLGLKTIMDFGANATLTGGVALQTQESWESFINKDNVSITFGGNNFELYFEEDDFDAFIAKLENIPNVNYVHPVNEHAWGQRVVHFYDLDKHIIEVGENLSVVCKRFLDSGMTPEQVAKRMDVPLELVTDCLK